MFQSIIILALRCCHRDLERAVEELSELIEQPLEPEIVPTLRQKVTDKTVSVLTFYNGLSVLTYIFPRCTCRSVTRSSWKTQLRAFWRDDGSGTLLSMALTNQLINPEHPCVRSKDYHVKCPSLYTNPPRIVFCTQSSFIDVIFLGRNTSLLYGSHHIASSGSHEGDILYLPNRRVSRENTPVGGYNRS